jgi:hypothetical protein
LRFDVAAAACCLPLKQGIGPGEDWAWHDADPALAMAAAVPCLKRVLMIEQPV